MLSPVRGVFAGCVACVCGMHAVGWRITAGLCHAFPEYCRSNATRAAIANPPNSAQLGGIPYHSAKLHSGPCNSVGMRLWTDTQTGVTTIHFSWSTTHAKCSNIIRTACQLALPVHLDQGQCMAYRKWRGRRLSLAHAERGNAPLCRSVE